LHRVLHRPPGSSRVRNIVSDGKVGTFSI
jgi:hypothetical protein